MSCVVWTHGLQGFLINPSTVEFTFVLLGIERANYALKACGKAEDERNFHTSR
jgi:hypothetical protein